jgi:hypothetical protein
MFKRKEDELTSIRLRVYELERSLWNITRELHGMADKWETMNVVKHDMAKMDAVVAMVSELARRIDFIGIPKLPDECVCEPCGCKK